MTHLHVVARADEQRVQILDPRRPVVQVTHPEFTIASLDGDYEHTRPVVALVIDAGETQYIARLRLEEFLIAALTLAAAHEDEAHRVGFPARREQT